MKRNVLLIMADGFRADCLGAVGNPVIQTPNLEALAREGVLFTHCFGQTTPCAPSRMCLLTGRYMCSTGCLDNGTPLVDAEDNVGMHLRNHGFETAVIGYQDYTVDPRTLPEDDPRRERIKVNDLLPGFDVVLDHTHDSPEYFEYLRQKGYPEQLLNHRAINEPNVPQDAPPDVLPMRYPAHFTAEDSPTRFVTDTAIDYVTARRGKGWFLNLNYITPHGPYVSPAPYHAMYDPDDVPAALRRPEELDNPHPYLHRFATNNLGAFQNESELRQARATVYGMITELDACLGRLFQALKDTGQWDNTLIVFTSDHAEHLGDHYLNGKAHYFDTAMRVPFIVRDPSPEADTTRGRQLDGLCEAVDIAPTLCAFTETPQHPRFQGQSVLGQVHGEPAARAKERVFYEFYYHFSLTPEEKARTLLDECRLWAVRDRRYKYVQFGEAAMPPLLFDLDADPCEFHNLAGDPCRATLIAKYCQHLIRWRIRNEDNRMEHWTQPLR